MPHEWQIGAPSLENGWQNVAKPPVLPPQLGAVAQAPANQQMMAGVSGDPFTYAKDGTKVQFYLPLHKDVKLLACGDFSLHGSTRGSGIAGDSQQWFEQFRVLIDGDEKLRCGLNSLKTAEAAGNLTTM